MLEKDEQRSAGPPSNPQDEIYDTIPKSIEESLDKIQTLLSSNQEKASTFFKKGA